MIDILSDTAQEFIDSWKKYDALALRISTSAEVERRNGRRTFTGYMTLKAETDRLLDAKNALADELGISSVHLMRALQELRRDGVDHAKAVHLVIRYLGDLNI